MRRIAGILAGVLLGMSGVWAAGPVDDALALQRRMVEVFSANEEKVVRIKAVHEDEEGEVSLRVGTGFFISSRGLLLTNASIITGAERLWIEHGDLRYPARLEGTHARTNIALLQVQGVRGSPFQYIALDEARRPEVGTLLVSIGCALEFPPSPRMGLVSGEDSNFGERVFPTPYLRTTIPANPGEGGAPVLDLNGRLLGMIVASLPEVSASYVLPVEALERVRNDLVLSGEVEEGWIGLEVEKRPRRIGDDEPLVVTAVEAGGPGEAAGLREGDRILSLDGEGASTIDRMRSVFFLTRPGQFLDMTILRDGEERNIGLQVEARPPGKVPAQGEAAASGT